MAFMAASSRRGKERGEKALRGAGSWAGSKDPVTETLEIAAKEVGGGELQQTAPEITLKPGVMSAKEGMLQFAGLHC